MQIVITSAEMKRYAYTTLIVLAALLTIGLFLACSNNKHRTPAVSSPLPTDKSSASDTSREAYQDVDYKFTLRYPSEYKVEARPSNGLPFDKEVLFFRGSSVPLRLGIINLSRYLPKTNTPTIAEYLNSLKSSDRFTQADIGGKNAYEYVTCGRAACTQEVVFIQNNLLYQFSIEFQNTEPSKVNFEASPPAIKAIVQSITFHS